MTAEANLAALAIELPPAAAPKGLYRPALVVGGLLYTSGHLPTRADGSIWTGALGSDLDVAAGQQAARAACLSLLASVRGALGSLDRVARVVKLVGLVHCTPQFTQQPAVINGASELLAAVFGAEAGVGVRTAAGAPALPLGAAVEIEAILELRLP